MSKEKIFKNNEKTWTDFAKNWAKGTPPWRPSRGEIEIYKEYVEKIQAKLKTKCRALLLGATPELRDMMARLNIDVTLVDVNPNMIKAMDSLLEYSDNKEKKVIANWLDIPLPDKQFDVVLCDQGIHWIPFEKWDAFFIDKIRLLKRDGYFINGIVTVEKSEVLSTKELVNIYKKNLDFNREEKFYYIYRVIFGLKQREGKAVHISQYKKELYEFYKRGLINNSDVNKLLVGWEDAKPVMLQKELVDEILSEYFQLKSIRVNYEHPVFTCHKIYFCQVK